MLSSFTKANSPMPEQPKPRENLEPKDARQNRVQSDAVIQSKDQSDTWNKTQESHKLPEDDTASRLMLTADERDLLATAAYQKFEITGSTGAERSNCPTEKSKKSNKGSESATHKKDAQEHRKPLAESDPNYFPIVSSTNVLSAANHLYLDRHRFRKSTSPIGPKCNLFIDAVMHDSKLPRPWVETGLQGCDTMNDQLARDPRYEQVWSTDYSNYQMAYENWDYFEPRPCDIFIWSTNKAVHSAMSDGDGKLYYAGSANNASGTGHVTTESFTGKFPKAETNYGPPTSVYRYKKLQL